MEVYITSQTFGFCVCVCGGGSLQSILYLFHSLVCAWWAEGLRQLSHSHYSNEPESQL